MSAKLAKDANGCLSTAIAGTPKAKYGVLAKSVSEAFSLRTCGALTDSMDEIFQEYTDGDYSISIEWDIWTGFSVRALSSDSDSLVKDIHFYLDQHYSD
jgi:hypothetical protein